MTDCLDKETMKAMQSSRRRYADMRVPPHILRRYQPKLVVAPKAKRNG